MNTARTAPVKPTSITVTFVRHECERCDVTATARFREEELVQAVPSVDGPDLLGWTFFDVRDGKELEFVPVSASERGMAYRLQVAAVRARRRADVAV